MEQIELRIKTVVTDLTLPSFAVTKYIAVNTKMSLRPVAAKFIKILPLSCVAFKDKV